MSFKSRRCVRSRSLSILSGPARTRDPFMMAIHLGLSFTPPQKSLCHSLSKLTCRSYLQELHLNKNIKTNYIILKYVHYKNIHLFCFLC